MPRKKRKKKKYNKGGTFERSICVKLSLWWTGGKDDDIFWRSTTSGARATTRAKKGKKTRGHNGDVCATHPSGNPLVDLFSIELKRGYSTKTLFDLLDVATGNARPKYMVWIDKAIAAEHNAKSYSWMIIFKRDRREESILLPYHAMEVLLGTDTMDCTLEYALDGYEVPYLTLRIPQDQPHAEDWLESDRHLLAMRFDDWLRIITPKMIKEKAKYL